jgi:aspartyl-tRNA(Asn)/glutamyl-tRNA(Gln) amidotransferase subunit A
MEYIAGWDPLDKTSEDKEVPAYTKIIEKSTLKGIRIGVPKEFFFDCLYPEVEHLFYDFIETLSSNGSIIAFDLDLYNNIKYYRSWRDIRLAEASEIHLKWLNTGAAEGYSNEVRNMLIQGRSVSAVDYIRALRTVKEIRKEFLSILSRNVDAIITPTTIIPAPRFDEETVSIGKNTLETRQALLRNTIVFNSTGLPAISIPIGLTKDNMPVGAQIIGPPFNEDMILSIAYSYECMNNSIDKFIINFAAVNKNKL